MKEKNTFFLILKIKKLKILKDLDKKFSLVKAKVNGFFLNDKQLKSIYKDNKNIESLYAYSHRNYRVGKIEDALILVNKCIEFDANNPFFYELKGQILFENGKIRESIPQFRKAIQLMPNEKSFRLFLAKSLYHTKNKNSYNESIKILWSYIKEDDFPYDAWHYLGLNYGKLKKHDYSSYALAEKYLLVNQIKNAKIHIQRVKKFSKDKVLLTKVADLEKEILTRESQ